MVQVKAFVLFVDFLCQALAQLFNLLVVLKHLLTLVQWHFDFVSVGKVCRLERLSWPLKPREEVVRGFSRDCLLLLIPGIGLGLGAFSEAFLAKLTLCGPLEDDIEALVTWALLHHRRLWADLHLVQLGRTLAASIVVTSSRRRSRHLCLPVVMTTMHVLVTSLAIVVLVLLPRHRHSVVAHLRASLLHHLHLLLDILVHHGHLLWINGHLRVHRGHEHLLGHLSVLLLAPLVRVLTTRVVLVVVSLAHFLAIFQISNNYKS